MEELYKLEPEINKVCVKLLEDKFTYSLKFYDSDFLFSKGTFVLVIHNASKGIAPVVDIMRLAAELGLKAFADEVKEKKILVVAMLHPDFSLFSSMLNNLLNKCGLGDDDKSSNRVYPHSPYQSAFEYLLSQTKIRVLMPDKKSPEENTFFSLCKKFYLLPVTTLYPQMAGLRTEKIVEFELSMPDIKKSLRKKLGLPL